MNPCTVSHPDNGAIEAWSATEVNSHPTAISQCLMTQLISQCPHCPPPFRLTRHRVSHRRRIRNCETQSSTRRHCSDLHRRIAVIVGILAFQGRPKPQGAGSIDFVAAAEVPGQNMILAAITFTLHNTAQKPLWIHTLRAQLTTADGKTFEDEAASAVDFDRYFQAFPALKESSEPPLSPETKVLPERTEGHHHRRIKASPKKSSISANL